MLYTVHFTTFSLGGPFFGHGVLFTVIKATDWSHWIDWRHDW